MDEAVDDEKQIVEASRADPYLCARGITHEGGGRRAMLSKAIHQKNSQPACRRGYGESSCSGSVGSKVDPLSQYNPRGAKLLDWINGMYRIPEFKAR